MYVYTLLKVNPMSERVRAHALKGKNRLPLESPSLPPSPCNIAKSNTKYGKIKISQNIFMYFMY